MHVLIAGEANPSRTARGKKSISYASYGPHLGNARFKEPSSWIL
jgi:hypothetical protein